MRLMIRCAMLTAALLGTAAAQVATQPDRPKFVFSTPPGFEKFEVTGHTAVCEPANRAWVEKAIKQMKPATRPTTMPADILARAATSRSEIIKGLVADVGITDEKTVTEFYDKKLVPTLTKYDELRPPVYYLVVTRDKLRELTKQRWGWPRFYYDGPSDLPVWDETLILSIDRPVEDSVVVFYPEAGESDQKRDERFTGEIRKMDEKLSNLIAFRAQLESFNLISQHIGRTYFEPLKLQRDQMWISLGSAAVLTSKYASMLTGRSRQSLLEDVTYENQKFLVSAASVDLLHPLDESRMRKGAIPAYTQAMRRKAAAVVSDLLAKAGDGAVGKIFAAIKKTPPADGAALVKLVQETTGIDVTKELAPRQPETRPATAPATAPK